MQKQPFPVRGGRKKSADCCGLRGGGWCGAMGGGGQKILEQGRSFCLGEGVDQDAI